MDLSPVAEGTKEREPRDGPYERRAQEGDETRASGTRRADCAKCLSRRGEETQWRRERVDTADERDDARHGDRRAR